MPPRGPHILIVDDDEEICTLLAENLGQEGFVVYQAGDGGRMYEVLAAESIDLILLDLNLPGVDGLTLCRELRAHFPIPIIVVTARDGPIDRIIGLELGADDYVAKPFEPRELTARIRSVLRRSQTPTISKVQWAREARFGGWVLHLKQRHLVDPDDRIVILSGMEMHLLKIFVEHANVVLSRKDLLAMGASSGGDTSGRTIDNQVSRLRQKLSYSNGGDELIKTLRGFGYIFAADIHFH